MQFFIFLFEYIENTKKLKKLFIPNRKEIRIPA